MDKFFVKLGLHRFWSFVFLKLSYIVFFVLACSYHVHSNWNSDVSFDSRMNYTVFVVYSYVLAFIVVGVIFSIPMKKIVDANTLAYFDADLVEALMREAQNRCTPITWNMVVRVVRETRDLNIELEKKRIQSLAYTAQKAWYDSRSL